MTINTGIEIEVSAEAQHPVTLTSEQRAHLGMPDVATEE